MQNDVAEATSPRHAIASRILRRRFFRVLYERRAEDLQKNFDAVGLVYRAARQRFGEEYVDRDTNIDLEKPETSEPEPFRFAVERQDGTVVSSIQESQILSKLPKAVFDYVFVAPELLEEARAWLQDGREEILAVKEPK